jgi:hypothetical protein
MERILTQNKKYNILYVWNCRVKTLLDHATSTTITSPPPHDSTNNHHRNQTPVTPNPNTAITISTQPRMWTNHTHQRITISSPTPNYTPKTAPNPLNCRLQLHLRKNTPSPKYILQNLTLTYKYINCSIISLNWAFHVLFNLIIKKVLEFTSFEHVFKNQWVTYF